MRAIILAAGVARRLYPLTFDKPKCLLEVAGQPILDYQVKALKRVGISKATIVVGYYKGMIINHLKTSFDEFEFNFVNNPHFFETNTSYSLHLCEDVLREGECLLMNGDVLYPVELLQRVLDDDKDNVLAVEAKQCGKEEVKVIEGADERIVAIGKELIEENSLGEFIGVAKLSEVFNSQFADSLSQLIEAGGKADYFEAAIHPLLAKIELHYVDVSDLPCIEIDFVEDLDKAAELATSDLFKSQR
jgi:choline kinase